MTRTTPATRHTVTVATAGAFLATRARGAQTRRTLEHEIAGQPTPGELAIDFHGVQAMTNLYTYELIGEFYAALAAGEVRVPLVYLTGLTPETRDAVSICLERRRLLALDAGHLALLGHTLIAADTYVHALRLGEFRTAQLASSLGISVANANNRLRPLLAAAVLTRSLTAPAHGGKEYTYRAPRPRT